MSCLVTVWSVFMIFYYLHSLYTLLLQSLCHAAIFNEKKIKKNLTYKKHEKKIDYKNT